MTTLVFATLSIYLLLLYNSYKTNTELVYNDEITYKNDLINDLINTISIQSDFSGYYKFSEDFIVKDIDGKSLMLRDIINKSTIVLYIDRFQCQSCFVEEINELKERIKKDIIDIQPVIFAGNFQLRDFKALIKSEGVDIESYMVDCTQSDFLGKMCKSGHPYFFLIRDDYEVSNVFFSNNKTRPHLNERYFINLNKVSKMDMNEDMNEDNNLMIIEPTINLGNIKLKKKYSTTFEIKNNGQTPIVINSISSSCGCVIPSRDITPLMPGSSRHINVDIIPTERGDFSKSITLDVRSKKSPFIQMWIFANVQ